jgi:hypothetical protein
MENRNKLQSIFQKSFLYLYSWTLCAAARGSAPPVRGSSPRYPWVQIPFTIDERSSYLSFSSICPLVFFTLFEACHSSMNPSQNDQLGMQKSWYWVPSVVLVLFSGPWILVSFLVLILCLSTPCLFFHPFLRTRLYPCPCSIFPCLFWFILVIRADD